MKEWMAYLLAVSLPLSLMRPAAQSDAPQPSAKSAVLMSQTGELLYAFDEDLLLPIASTTKLMTALVVAERCDLEEEVEIDKAWCGVEGSSMYLCPGERYTLRELLTGLLLVSGNDAARALACICAGDELSFSALMNEKAFSLGMTRSHFMNPHGLNEPEHYSTARDLAVLMQAVMDVPVLAEILAMPSAAVGDRQIYTHNKLLRRYDGCLGGKTGYTAVAGRCLVTCAEREGTRLYCVTLSDPNDWRDHERLYDWGFSRYEILRLDAGSIGFELPVFSGVESSVRVIPTHPLQLLLPKGAEPSYVPELPMFCFAPIREQARAGTLRVELDGEALAEIELVFERTIPVK